MAKTKTPRAKAKVNNIGEIPLESIAPNTEQVALENPLTEMQGKVTMLCQQYMIADQSDLITYALNSKFYKFEDIKNYGVKLKAKANKFFLIYNNLAEHLLDQKEMVLINKDGTWWFTQVDENTNVIDNKALHRIITKSEQMIADQVNAKLAATEEVKEVNA